MRVYFFTVSDDHTVDVIKMITVTAKMSKDIESIVETKSAKPEGCTRDSAAKVEGCLKATTLNASGVKFNPP